jgi:hypothetical protein
MSEIYEGNSITVNNINKSKAKIKNRGGSYQKVKPYNNLVKNADFKSDLNEWKASSKFSVVNKNGIKYLKISTSTSGFNRAYQGLNTIAEHKYYVAMKCIKDKAWGSAELFLSASPSDNYPQPAKGIASHIYQNETSVSTILVPKSSNCSIGVMFQSTSDEVLEAYFRDFICIDLTELYGEGNEPDQTTCDNLFTFDKVAYGTSPSTYTISKIENVGDKINILNKDVVNATNNLRSNVLETGIRLIANKAGNYTYGAFKLGGRELLGETLGVHADIKTSSGKPRISIFAGNSSSLTKSMLGVVLSTSGTGYITLPSSLSDELDTISAALYVTTDTSVATGTYVDYTNLKVQVGDGEVIYSDYNCGSVGVTIGNKNLYKIEKVINDSNYPEIIYKDENGNVSFTTGGIPLIIAPTKTKEKTEYTYILKCKSNVTTENNINFTGIYEDGTRELLSVNKKKDTNEFIVKFKTDKEKTLAYVTQQYTNSAGVTIITEGTMILEGDYLNLEELYEIHQEQEILFPLAEGQKLRSLPNGIKDYLAEDGIHKNVGTMILNGGADEGYNKAVDNKFALGINTKKGLLLKNLKTDNSKISVLSDKLLGVPWNTMFTVAEGWQIALRQDGNYTYLRLLTTGMEDVKALTTFLQSNNIAIQYPLAEEEIIPYTPEQQNAFYQLQNIVLYDGINYISTDNELGSMSVEVSKIIEDYETYISSNGFFINSQNDIHYLIDFSESELPCMAEATETTVKAAGRNGDIVLSTTYDPNNFNIVCYTEDNLTQEEKVKEEMKLKKLLNSIKNKTIPLAFEKDDKFYKVKYSGAFSSTNFPKHLKFSIPLKTSEAYGKDLIKKVIFGNGEETSDTFEDVGAIFTIKGPANSPIISLNDYSIEYDNPLLEGDKLIINSSNSTITHINLDGVKTNAMRYYNHQFPKIENGKNVLKVLSGVNEANVSVEWYDYKF